MITQGDRERSVAQCREYRTAVWVKSAFDIWTREAGITEGRVFRAINRGGLVWGEA
jgi:hypothetical protein